MRTHLDRWGELRHQPHQLIDVLEASGLVGHGGAWFPVAAKWRTVAAASRRRPVVVANGAEGEPASRKDALLLSHAPHLVLDGVALAASTLRAQQAIVYVPASSIPTVEAALVERRFHGLDPIAIELVESPDTFIAGQESAVVNELGRRRGAIPSFVGLTTVREPGSEAVPPWCRTPRRSPMWPSSPDSERTGSEGSARHRTRARIYSRSVEPARLRSSRRHLAPPCAPRPVSGRTILPTPARPPRRLWGRLGFR